MNKNILPPLVDASVTSGTYYCNYLLYNMSNFNIQRIKTPGEKRPSYKYCKYDTNASPKVIYKNTFQKSEVNQSHIIADGCVSI